MEIENDLDCTLTVLAPEGFTSKVKVTLSAYWAKLDSMVSDESRTGFADADEAHKLLYPYQTGRFDGANDVGTKHGYTYGGWETRIDAHNVRELYLELGGELPDEEEHDDAATLSFEVDRLSFQTFQELSKKVRAEIIDLIDHVCEQAALQKYGEPLKQLFDNVQYVFNLTDNRSYCYQAYRTLRVKHYDMTSLPEGFSSEALFYSEYSSDRVTLHTKLYEQQCKQFWETLRGENCHDFTCDDVTFGFQPITEGAEKFSAFTAKDVHCVGRSGGYVALDKPSWPFGDLEETSPAAIVRCDSYSHSAPIGFLGMEDWLEEASDTARQVCAFYDGAKKLFDSMAKYYAENVNELLFYLLNEELEYCSDFVPLDCIDPKKFYTNFHLEMHEDAGVGSFRLVLLVDGDTTDHYFDVSEEELMKFLIKRTNALSSLI